MKETPRRYAQNLLEFASKHSREELEALVEEVSKYFASRGKIRFLENLKKEVERLGKIKDREYDVHVSSAKRLDDSMKKELTDTFATVLDGTVTLHVEENPALIGGSVLTIGDTMIDASLLSRVNILKSALTSPS